MPRRGGQSVWGDVETLLTAENVIKAGYVAAAGGALFLFTLTGVILATGGSAVAAVATAIVLAGLWSLAAVGYLKIREFAEVG